ncbi:MAG: tRNA (adenosine(37)-N6)-threonylcarbamoyltransferase complex transferase subunit TsaD [Acidimicrobiales bacterium]
MVPAGRDQAILAIETSCDETAAAVVVGGREVLSSVVSSQVDLHSRFGGVVPEIASRAHLDLLTPVVAEALVEAGLEGPDLAAVAATTGPGLAGALLVGVAEAKALALAWGRPFVGVNHLEGHVYASFLEEPDLPLPLVVLLVSGGHTLLVLMTGHGQYRLLGSTVDDAAGEAFDKVARFLGLGYPGGPIIDRLAVQGNPGAAPMPRPMPNGLDFSFSGLKTALINFARRHPEADVADMAAGFQAAVVDVLVDKASRAVTQTGAAALCIGGGVAANSALRERISAEAETLGVRCYLPSRSMCTDNAAMVGAAAWRRLVTEGPTSLSAGISPSLALA